MRILVTGGAGFIGSAVIRRILGHTPHHAVNVDKLTYAASPATLARFETHPRYAFERADIADGEAIAAILEKHGPDAVIHLAAETHVDRSIDDPEAFVRTNLLGTFQLLSATRKYWEGLPSSRREAFRFHHVSTDEAFGALGPEDPAFNERTRYDPRSPYSASKAGSDHLARAWGHTYGLPVLVTSSTNNYGPYQFPEKLIPLMIIKGLRGERLPIYGTGGNIRDWIHVDDHAEAMLAVLEHGRAGDTYIVGANAERTNSAVVEAVCDLLDELAPPLTSGERRRSLVHAVPDRPGHDFRYAADTSRIEAALGWRPRRSFEDGLRETVIWYLQNEAWWRKIKEKQAEYKAFTEKWYADRK